MKLGFICLNGTGHLNPMTALARQLEGRNHEVIFLYSSDAVGLPVFPDEQNSAEHNAAIAEVSRMQGEDALEFGVKAIIGFTESILNSLPTTVVKTGVEALLIDSAHYYVELGAIELGIPYIHVSNAMYHDYSGYTPLCLYGWPYENKQHAIARNREGVARFARMLGRNRAGVERYVEKARLKVDWADLSSTISPLASVTQVPRAFDFESFHWPKQFYHTGPFHDGMGRTKVDFPWDRLTGQPLIYASMGTVLNGNLDAFQTIGTALAKHSDLQLVLSVGDRVAGLGLHHSCRTKHGVGVFGARRPTSRHSGNL
jgi:zeaxanthin glucosyltransferase